MFSTLFTVALFFTAAFQCVFAEFSVATPEIHACKGKDLKVTWQAAKAPYNVIIVPSDDPCGDALVDAGDFDQTFATFKTDDLKAGQNVQISIEDADGEEGWSGVIKVQDCPADAASSAGAAVPTTLVVGNTLGAGGYGAATPSAPVTPVGAANAGSDPFGDASAAVPRHVSIPAAALSAIFGAVILLL